MFLVNCIGSGPWLQGCGNVCIPADIAKITSLVYNIIKVVVPLVLIFIGMFDMAKAVTSKSEDEVKKAQQLFAKKAVAGALVFILFSAITWMLSILDSTSGNANGEKNVASCLNALFDYSSSSSSSGKSGGDNGKASLDPDGVCKANGYWGALRIVGEVGSGSYSEKSAYYVCANYNRNDRNCDEGDPSNGTKYTLADGSERCVVEVSGTKSAVIYRGTAQDNRIYSPCWAHGTEGNCNSCCKDSNYRSGKLVYQDGKNSCMCVNKK